MRESKWRDSALCAEISSEYFFADDSHNVKTAKSICAKCPVKIECREYAMNNLDLKYGVFGGLTARDRGVIRAKQERLKEAA